MVTPSLASPVLALLGRISAAVVLALAVGAAGCVTLPGGYAGDALSSRQCYGPCLEAR